MCFWLCQRGSAQFWFCLGPTDSCSGVCGDGSVGGQSRAVLYHTTEKKSFLALQIVSAPSWQIAKPGALVPRGRHLWNFGPLPNLANKMQSTPGPAFGGVGARKPSAFFPFYILIPNLALFLHLALESKERGRVESKTERYLAQVNPQKEKKKKKPEIIKLVKLSHVRCGNFWVIQPGNWKVCSSFPIATCTQNQLTLSSAFVF